MLYIPMLHKFSEFKLFYLLSFRQTYHQISTWVNLQVYQYKSSKRKHTPKDIPQKTMHTLTNHSIHCNFI